MTLLYNGIKISENFKDYSAHKVIFDSNVKYKQGSFVKILQYRIVNIV